MLNRKPIDPTAATEVGRTRVKEGKFEKQIRTGRAGTSASPLFADGRNPKVRKLNKMISIQLRIASVEAAARLLAKNAHTIFAFLFFFYRKPARGTKSFLSLLPLLCVRIANARFSNCILTLFVRRR